MKPLFCVDITHDPNNETLNGTHLATAKVSEETAAVRDGLQQAADSFVKKSNLPFPLLIAKYVLGGVFLMVALIALTATIEQGFAAVWNNASVLLVVAALCGAAALGLLIYEKSRKTVSEESGEGEKILGSYQSVEQRVREELGVPADIPAVDLLQFQYKVKEDGSVKVSSLQAFPYMTFEMWIFRKEDTLCLADWDTRYEIPMNALGELSRVDKSVAIPTVLWTKPCHWSEEPYRSFGIKEINGTLTMKPYYILTFTLEGEEYGIYIPPYERSLLEDVTGLKAHE